MTPVPRLNAIPKHYRWTVVQRAIKWPDIRKLAERIVAIDGQLLQGNHERLLRDFADQDYKDEWLKIWVTVVQTLGLAYTADEGTTIHATGLGRFIALHDAPDAFYLYWALRFQFPHGYPKQRHYVENNVCVQPIVLLVEYLLELEHKSDSKNIYLTYDEVINFCMRRANHDARTTEEDVKKILANRRRGYDYATEKRADPAGYEAVRKNFANRSKLYFEPTHLLTYEQDRITIPGKALKASRFLLDFRHPGIPYAVNSEEARNKYLRTAFACTEEELTEMMACVTELRHRNAPPKPGAPEKDEEVIQEAADELVQTEKTRTKAELLEEARKYIPKAGSRIDYGRKKVRIDDARQKALIKELEDFSCQVDGFVLEYTNKKGKKLRYIEAAHIQAKKEAGNETLSNIIVLCPNCHKKCDCGLMKIDFEKKVVEVEGKPAKLHHDHHLFVAA